jgi:hypothetical protein
MCANLLKLKHATFRSNQIIPIGTIILLLGAWLRLADIGADAFMADQERISILAQNLGREGAWEVLGPRMSVGSLKHSPFTIYLYALPYRLDNDPHIARIFTALTNLIAVAVVQVIGVRYFGRITGLLAAFFFATNPVAVHHSRFIWNSNLAAPFVMLFVLSTLRGYYDRKPLARLAHLPMLSLAGQCHPSLFLIAPLAFISWMHAWRLSKGSRQHLIAHTTLSAILALALMAPWGIGLYRHLSTLEYLRPITTGSSPGLQGVAKTIYSALGGSFGTFAQDAPSLPHLAILTLVAAAWLLARGLSCKDGLPGLLAVLGFFVVPTVVVVLGSQFMQELTATLFFARGVELNWWIYTLMGNAALIQGAFIGGVLIHRPAHGRLSWLWNWRGLLQTRYLRGPTLLALLAVGAILMRAHVRFDYRHDTGVHSLYEGQNTLDDSSSALKHGEALALRNNQELLLLASDPPLQTMRCIGCRNWEALMLTKKDDLRVIWDDYGLPLPRNGAVLLAPFNYSARPFVFSGGENVFTWFSVASLPSADHFKPDLPLPQPVHFSNGATVLGFLRETPNSAPVPAKLWAVHMLWRVDTPEPECFKLFAHLVDANGVKYAQVDPPGMLPGQQHTGEHVLSQLVFQVDESLPASGPLFVHFGMYNDTGQADVTSTTVEQPDLVQIRGSNKPLARMGNGLELDSFTTQHKLQQGPPLNITAIWHTPPEGTNPEPLRLNWQLESPDNLLVFERTTELLPQVDRNNLPGNLFIAGKYNLRIPTEIVPGKHRLTLQVIDSTDYSSALRFVDHIDIMPRDRNFDLPPMQNTLSATFSDKIRLAGYDVEQGDRALTLTLHWQALDRLPVDYKYFIHVWSGDEIIAQADAMPDSYRYPTSWWAPHEVFSDTVKVELGDSGPREVLITVGLYEAVTGARLPVVTTGAPGSPDNWATLRTLTLD